MHYGFVRADAGNRGPITIFFAKQFDKFIRSELGEANRVPIYRDELTEGN
jgi:hypothetical protein